MTSITIKASLSAAVTAKTLAAIHRASMVLSRATKGEVTVGIDMPNGTGAIPIVRKLGRPRGTGRPLERKPAPVVKREKVVVLRRPRRKRRANAKEED